MDKYKELVEKMKEVYLKDMISQVEYSIIVASLFDKLVIERNPETLIQKFNDTEFRADTNTLSGFEKERIISVISYVNDPVLNDVLLKS